MAAAVEIPGRRLHALRRPLILVPPGVPPHDEDLRRRPVVGRGLRTLQPLAEPGVRDLVIVPLRLRPEVELAERSVERRRGVAPGADDQALVLAGERGHAILPHAGELLDRAKLLVVPAGAAQHGHVDILVAHLVREVILHRLVQEADPVFVHARHRARRNLRERQVPEPLAAVARIPQLVRLFRRLRRTGNLQPAGHVGADGVDRPGHAPAEPDHAAHMAVEVVRDDALREHADEMRRPGRRHLPLRHAAVGIAEGADLARGPRQRRAPLHRIVAVLDAGIARIAAHVQQRLALGIVPAANILKDHDVAARRHLVADLGMHLAPGLAVRRAAEQHREEPVRLRPIDVGAQDHAIAHGRGHVCFNVDVKPVHLCSISILKTYATILAQRCAEATAPSQTRCVPAIGLAEALPPNAPFGARQKSKPP